MYIKTFLRLKTAEQTQTPNLSKVINRLPVFAFIIMYRFDFLSHRILSHGF